MCSHLVTGDLLILSGSSVTLKKKTKVSVRNQSANHIFTPTPPPISSMAMSVNPRQPITTQNKTTRLQITDGSSPTLTTLKRWMDVKQQNKWEGWTNTVRGNNRYQPLVLITSDTHSSVLYNNYHIFMIISLFVPSIILNDVFIDPITSLLRSPTFFIAPSFHNFGLVYGTKDEQPFTVHYSSVIIWEILLRWE